MKQLDARGLSCPQPMLMAKKAMEGGATEAGEGIEVLVDCAASVENIGRAAKKLGWSMAVTPADGEESRLALTKK